MADINLEKLAGWNNAGKYCKEYANEAYKNIPEASCDKNKLISIILACDIFSSDEAVAILEGKIEYHNDLASSSEGLECQAYEAHMAYLAIYEKMIDSIKKYCK